MKEYFIRIPDVSTREASSLNRNMINSMIHAQHIRDTTRWIIKIINHKIIFAYHTMINGINRWKWEERRD